MEKRIRDKWNDARSKYPIELIILVAVVVVAATTFVVCTSNDRNVQALDDSRADTTSIMEEDTDFAAVPGYDDLYYSKTTGVVYVVIRNNDSNRHSTFGMMSAYYAPNGLPYRYDRQTGSLMEIPYPVN